MQLKWGRKLLTLLSRFFSDFYLLTLLLFIFIGALLRFYNLNWDLGNYFHPDERNIANAVSQIEFFNQLNPGFFAYGGFIIYLIRFVCDLLILITKNSLWGADWGQINLVGRYLSALFSTLTIPLVYLLVKKVFDKKTALLSASLFTFVPTSIQIAHFAITESFLTMIGVLSCILALKLYQNPTTKNYFYNGLILGIAVASKTSAVSYFIFSLIAILILSLKNIRKIHKNILSTFILLFTALITFSFFSPYTFLSWTKFLESMSYESGVVSGALRVPYTLQFEKTVPYFFQLQNLFWQIGVISIPAIFGAIYLMFLIIIKRNPKVLIFGVFPILYFLYVGSWHTKFLRYLLPIIPFLIIAGSLLLVRLWQRFRIIGTFIIFSYFLITFIWGISFFSIYTKEQTRVTASKWIYSNVLEDSRILTEHWDDGLPIPLIDKDGHNLNKSYQIEQLKIYDQDNLEKINYYSERLTEADYIVINSRRLYGTLINLPEKYPVTSKYYKLLFEEKLGYQKVAQFSSYPEIFGFEINDDDSEETFQVYDHPKVVIFKNNHTQSSQQIKFLLQN